VIDQKNLKFLLFILKMSKTFTISSFQDMILMMNYQINDKHMLIKYSFEVKTTGISNSKILNTPLFK
jgi:hypothetical protein